MYLILAQNEDVHADAVLYYLQQSGAEVRRFDIAYLFDEYGSIEYEENRQKISIEIGTSSGRLIFPNGDIIVSDDIKGIFCRSFYFPKAKDDVSVAEQLATAEIRCAIRGFFSLVPDSCIWLNNPYLEEKVDNKIYQHRCALLQGLNVPDTMVTNKADIVRSFYNKHHGHIIIKQLSDISLIDEKPITTLEGDPDYEYKGFYTSKVNAEDLDNLDDYFGQGSTPVLLQEELIKKSELRVTVVGNKCFSYRIYSQENTKSITDFRHVDNLKTEKCQLDSDIETKILKLVASWKISFVTIDLVETIDGRVVFLEANVVGNWLWLEMNKSGSDIAKAISALLLKN